MLQEPYPFEKARLVADEMADALALDLVSKNLVTDQIVMTIGYDIANKDYKGEITVDRYGRKIPKAIVMDGGEKIPLADIIELNET